MQINYTYQITFPEYQMSSRWLNEQLTLGKRGVEGKVQVECNWQQNWQLLFADKENFNK